MRPAGIAAIVLSVALWMAGCSDSYQWNQKLTVEVETPAGPVSGSSVLRVSKTYTDSAWAPPEARGLASGLHGEAVVVEVAAGRYLFALLGGVDTLAQAVFADRIEGLDAPDWAIAIQALRGKRAVPRKYYPLLVTFGDIADPKTVRRVDPGNLAASFGPGVSLKTITLEITDDKVTEGELEKVLGCLNSGKACVPLNTHLTFGNPMRNILNSSFRRK